MIYIDSNSSKPLYLQIYESIRESIIDGSMQKNSSLLPLRVLTKELNVSKNTVERAYQELLGEGLVRAVKGSGYYVEDIEKIFPKSYIKEYLKKPDSSSSDEHSSDSDPIRYDFRYSVGDTQFFPWTKWKQYVDESILAEESVQFSKYEANKGYFPLRLELSNFLRRTRGVECTPEQVIICAGTQYALETILSLLPPGGKHVAFEEPGYMGMRNVFRNSKCDIKSVNIDKDGIDVDYILNSTTDIVYLTPSHQFPTGVTTSLKKRLQLLEWADKNDGFIIENDYDSEFTYKKRIIPSLQSLDKNGHVIYLGTLSKAISPSIRCAYYILPKRLLRIYEKKYRYYNSALPTFVQNALANFIKDGLLDKYIRRVSVLNEQKYIQLRDSLTKLLPKEVKIVGPPAGTHVLVQIDCCKNEREFINFMKERKIGIHGSKKYWNSSNSPDNIFILGFSSIPARKIEKYVAYLASMIKEYITEKSMQEKVS